MNILPYLNFDGRCDEAIEFYKRALGAKVEMLMRFKEAPEQPPPAMRPPGIEDKVMHASLRIGESLLMASDGRCTGQTKFAGINLALSAANAAETQRYFTALSEGGNVTMPLAKTFFSPSFGMLTDRFGINWMIMAQA
jgi:PhnB protein